jgi:hypothetical protein
MYYCIEPSGQAVKQANYRRHQVLEGYVETLRHVRGEAYTELSMVLRKLLGAKYGRCVVQKGANLDPKPGAAMAKRTEFLQLYACAVRLQEVEKSIVVYFGSASMPTALGLRLPRQRARIFSLTGSPPS